MHPSLTSKHDGPLSSCTMAGLHAWVAVNLKATGFTQRSQAIRVLSRTHPCTPHIIRPLRAHAIESPIFHHDDDMHMLKQVGGASRSKSFCARP